MLESTDHHFGKEHRLRDDENSPGNAQADNRSQKEAGGTGVPEQSRVDRFHVKHTLFSAGTFHVKHALRPGEVCFT
ncbi:hypothetical protein [Streptomyces sp. KM273126]|uniref:hypothetical protein n=1 Tax=Streptomyces sp. KM273126 TaxID=2545247 RepID=UPI00215D95C0|nr:hypothetical protein [Streptomyces sp. KM273126]